MEKHMGAEWSMLCSHRLILVSEGEIELSERRFTTSPVAKDAAWDMGTGELRRGTGHAIPKATG